MTSGFEFLGFRFVMHWDRRYGCGPPVEIPKTKPPIWLEGQGTYGYEFRPVQSGFQASGAQSHPARVGELLPSLWLCRSDVHQARLVHWHAYSATLAEETPQSAVV